MKTSQDHVSGDDLTISQSRSKKQRCYSTETIPIDLIFEILSRLPVKSILSFLGVSKLWDSIILSPEFAEFFMKRSCARPKILFTCEKNGELIFFTCPQTQNLSPVVGVDRLSQFRLKGYCDTYTGGIVSGLVYCEHHRVIKERNTIKRIIGNPSTGQSLVLPELKTRSDRMASFLGYDPIEKQFKVLSMTAKTYGRVGISEDHQVLTLGTQKLSWRMIECLLPHYYLSRGICINGVLYYLATLLGEPNLCVTVCFDVRFEKFTFINKAEEMVNRFCLTLVNCNGKLGLLSEGQSHVATKETTCFELWVLVDAERHKWLKHVYELPLLWKTLYTGTTLVFVGVTGTTNEIVLAPPYYHCDPFYVFYYNMERKTIRRVEIQGMNEFKGSRVSTSLDHVDDFRLMQLFNNSKRL